MSRHSIFLPSRVFGQVSLEDWDGASTLLRDALAARAGQVGDCHAEVAHIKTGLAGCIVKQKGGEVLPKPMPSSRLDLRTSSPKPQPLSP